MDRGFLRSGIVSDFARLVILYFVSLPDLENFLERELSKQSSTQVEARQETNEETGRPNVQKHS